MSIDKDNKPSVRDAPSSVLTKQALNAILELLPVSIYWKNQHGEYQGCNQYMLNLVGLKEASQIIGKKDSELVSKVFSNKVSAIDNDVLKNKSPITVEEFVQVYSGENKTFLTTKTPLMNEHNEVIGLVGISIDITQQKQAEAREREALAESAVAQEHAKAEIELRQVVMVLAGSIAHDMRTPLAIVRMLGEVLGKLTPPLIKTYQLAQYANVPNIPDIHPRQFQKLPQISENLGNIVTEMNDYINITLKSLSQVLTKDLKPEDLERCSADYCISKAMSSYPFEDGERNLVHIDSLYQFELMGNQILLFRVLSNIIKNSLYQIHYKQKGEIFISTRDGGQHNDIVIKDTAGGASPEIVESLFGGYKTTKKQGTGVGLAFCKLTMENFQGGISCASVEGDYIEFVLTFPKVLDTN